MIKIYICPNCGWIRMVSRRKEVECHRCGAPQMMLSNLTMAQYTDMDEKAREDYREAWLYIHKRKGSNHAR